MGKLVSVRCQEHELDAINPNVTLLYLDKAGAGAAITITVGVGVMAVEATEEPAIIIAVAIAIVILCIGCLFLTHR